MGSEMCIRDRRIAVAYAALKNALKRRIAVIYAAYAALKNALKRRIAVIYAASFGPRLVSALGRMGPDIGRFIFYTTVLGFLWTSSPAWRLGAFVTAILLMLAQQEAVQQFFAQQEAVARQRCSSQEAAQKEFLPRLLFMIGTFIALCLIFFP